MLKTATRKKNERKGKSRRNVLHSTPRRVPSSAGLDYVLVIGGGEDCGCECGCGTIVATSCTLTTHYLTQPAVISLDVVLAEPTGFRRLIASYYGVLREASSNQRTYQLRAATSLGRVCKEAAPTPWIEKFR